MKFLITGDCSPAFISSYTEIVVAGVSAHREGEKGEEQEFVHTRGSHSLEEKIVVSVEYFVKFFFTVRILVTRKAILSTH